MPSLVIIGVVASSQHNQNGEISDAQLSHVHILGSLVTPGQQLYGAPLCHLAKHRQRLLVLGRPSAALAADCPAQPTVHTAIDGGLRIVRKDENVEIS